MTASIGAPGRGRRRAAVAAAIAAAAAIGLPRPLSRSFVAPAGEVLGRLSSDAALPDLPQIVLGDIAELATNPLRANTAEQNLTPMDKNGPDSFFFIYLAVSVVVVLIAIYLLTKPFWEQRWLIEKINKQKLKFITQEDNVTPLDQFELGRMYNNLLDFPSAIAEFEEVEEDFDDIRAALDPEDSMGALAARGQLHNSKGFALMKLDPPRTAQARREFVRAVTYWPEYPEALLNIGRELIKRKRFDVAVRTLNTALKWQPGSVIISEAADEARNQMEEQMGEYDDDDDEEESDEEEEEEQKVKQLKRA